jgi:hypothetical protein
MKLSQICVVIITFIQSTLHPHGFGNCTYVNLHNGQQQKIHLLCAKSLRTKTKVSSYNTHSQKYSRHAIKRCGQSNTNCYIRLKFDKDHNAHNCNDIICTPMQEFYCTQTNERFTCGTSGVIEPITPAALAHVYAQQNTSVPNSSNPRYNGPWARNWKEFFDTCPVGQKYKHLFKDIRKQNPKDGAPLRKILEDIPGAAMFKKGNILALDRAHAGDHLEVWDVNGNWIGVANLDGSKNAKKSDAESNPRLRNIREIV